MALNDIYRLALLGRNSGVEVVNVFHFREAVAGLPADQRATLANDFVGTMLATSGNTFKTAAVWQMTWHTVTVQRWWPYSESVFTLGGLSLTGQKSGTNPMPPCVAVCVTLFTPFGGRAGRGRIYLPASNTQEVVDGLLTDLAYTSYNGAMSTLSNRYIQQTGWSVSGFQYGLWSKWLSGAGPPFQIAGWREINGWRVNRNVRALSRRVRD